MEDRVWRISFSFSTEESHELFENMCEEFEDLAECVWKLNGQISGIWKVELEKVEAAISHPAIAMARYIREKRNVERIFPLLLNYSFLTTTFALYERHLGRLADLVQNDKKLMISYSNLKGSGVGRTFLYFERFCGIIRTQLPDYEVVDTMRLIRNCIVHDAGYFHSRNSSKAEEIENRVRRGHYLSAANRKFKDKYLQTHNPEGTHRLWFGRDYAYIMPCYCRDFFKGLFVAVGLARKSEGYVPISSLG